MNSMLPAMAAAAALAAPAAAGWAAPAGEAPIALGAADPGLTWGPCPPIFPAGCEIAVLHGDPAKPNADVFLRVPGGQRLPAHTHTSAERMILVSGALRVKYQGAPAVTLTPGMYAFGPAGRPHEADCQAGAACTLFIAFEGPVDAAAHPSKLD